MNDTTPRAPNELHFQTHDGESLFYRHWPATGATRRGAIVLFHRGHEHGARMAHLVDELDLPDFDFYAWDARGHGRSPGQRGYSPSFGTSVRDVQTFVQHIGTAHGVPDQDIHVVAQSVGAVLIATWAHDYAPKVRGLTLASPAFKVKLYVPFARAGLMAAVEQHDGAAARGARGGPVAVEKRFAVVRLEVVLGGNAWRGVGHGIPVDSGFLFSGCLRHRLRPMRGGCG